MCTSFPSPNYNNTKSKTASLSNHIMHLNKSPKVLNSLDPERTKYYLEYISKFRDNAELKNSTNPLEPFRFKKQNKINKKRVALKESRLLDRNNKRSRKNPGQQCLLTDYIENIWFPTLPC